VVRIVQQIDAGTSAFGETTAVGRAFALEAEQVAASRSAGSAVRRIAVEIDTAGIARKQVAGTCAAAFNADRIASACFAARATVLHVSLQVDASRSAARFAGTGYIELVDPRGHAIDGLRGELSANRHWSATVARSPKLGDQVRSRGVTRNDTGLSIAKCSLAADELKLEGGAF
jgi:hypothetical protein